MATATATIKLEVKDFKAEVPPDWCPGCPPGPSPLESSSTTSARCPPLKASNRFTNSGSALTSVRAAQQVAVERCAGCVARLRMDHLQNVRQRRALSHTRPEERFLIAAGEPFTHHNASIQVFTEGAGKCRVVWIADLLPNEITDTVEKMILQGLGVMKQTLEGSPARG